MQCSDVVVAVAKHVPLCLLMVRRSDWFHSASKEQRCHNVCWSAPAERTAHGTNRGGASREHQVWRCHHHTDCSQHAARPCPSIRPFTSVASRPPPCRRTDLEERKLPHHPVAAVEEPLLCGAHRQRRASGPRGWQHVAVGQRRRHLCPAVTCDHRQRCRWRCGSRTSPSDSNTDGNVGQAVDVAGGPVAAAVRGCGLCTEICIADGWVRPRQLSIDIGPQIGAAVTGAGACLAALQRAKSVLASAAVGQHLPEVRRCPTLGHHRGHAAGARDMTKTAVGP